MTKRPRKRMGRPPLPVGQARHLRMVFRTTAALQRDLTQAARTAGKTVSTMIHDILNNWLEDR